MRLRPEPMSYRHRARVTWGISRSRSRLLVDALHAVHWVLGPCRAHTPSKLKAGRDRSRVHPCRSAFWSGTISAPVIHSIVLALMLGYASVTLAAAPHTPALVAPADNASGASTSPLLQVGVSDPDGDPVTVTWYGRLLAAPGPHFTLIGLPDTQYYTGMLNGGTNAIFKTQTKWIVDQRAYRNIVDVVHLGDCTQNGDNGGNPIEWQRADTAMRAIENPATGLPAGIPYGICVGNHDQTPEGDAS